MDTGEWVSMKISPDDRWMICAPMRTGGRFVTNLITHLYHQYEIDIKVIESDHGGRLEEIPYGHVYQTHYAKDYHNLKHTPNLKIVVITRDIIDSILSMLVAIHLNKYHIYSIEEMNAIKLEKIPVDPATIKKYHFNYRLFYSTVQSLLEPSTIVLSYNDILCGAETIAAKIGLARYTTPEILSRIAEYLPIKNTWNNMDWIANSEEIKSVLNNLERRILQH